MNLPSLGWNDFFARQFQPYHAAGFVPARVAIEHKNAYEVVAADGRFAATCTGRLLHDATARAELPAVGDWVVLRPRAADAAGARHFADIHAVLPRQTKFSRRAAGADAVEQIVAANIDTVFLVTALDENFNLRRIERYLAVAWESGAQPVVVLNKSDLHVNPGLARREVESIAPGAPVVALSATAGDAIAALSGWLAPGCTVALLGSSGVGKSTLINCILGEEHQATGAVSGAVNKGRHTTTHRELLLAPSGAVVIDTPGMRELQLWDVDVDAIDSAFADIAALAQQCRFRNCTHRSEPGCAIQAALETGILEADRWASYQKLQREQAYAARKADVQLARATKSHWKKINRDLRTRQRLEERE